VFALPNSIFTRFVALVWCSSLPSCTTPGGQPATKTYATGAALGTLLGGGLGAGIGALSGERDGAVKGLMIGAGAGAGLGLAAAHRQALQRDRYAARFTTVNADLAKARGVLGSAQRSRGTLQNEIAEARVSRSTLNASLASLKQLRVSRQELTESVLYVPTQTSSGAAKAREINSAIGRLSQEERSLSDAIRRAEQRISE
jgi:hypothetical protein